LIFPIVGRLERRILTIFVHQDVVRLDVTMKDHLPMHDVYSSEHLLHHGLDLL
jgi:hypothetical protein